MVALAGTCCVLFEIGQTLAQQVPTFLLFSDRRLLRPFAWNHNNVSLVKTSAHAHCSFFWDYCTRMHRFFRRTPTMLAVVSFVCMHHVKARLNGCNMLGQHHPTLLATTCFLRLNTMLGHVGQCWIVLEDVR